MPPKHSKIDVSIVIPAYKEAQRIGATLDELGRYLKSADSLRAKEIEVIVVSADSADNTHEIVTAKARLFKHLELIKSGPKVGKGRDVKVGMLAARGEVVLFFDADLATPLQHIEQFLKLMDGGAQIVIATRGIRRPGNDILRETVSFVGNVLYRLLGGVWLEDSQCGFKMFSSQAAKICFSRLQLTGWGFDMEVLSIAKAQNIPITPVHIDDWHPVDGGSFDESILSNSFKAAAELLQIFWRRLSGSYRRRTPG